MPPKGFKSQTILGPMIKILGKGPFLPYLQSLELSLIKPGVTSRPAVADSYSPRDLLPLCDFRRLRALKLTGMLESYQEIIFRACWLNNELEDLTLVMASEPVLTSSESKKWKAIQGKRWNMQKYETVDKIYRGEIGQGILANEYGYGEYLDTEAIGKARLNAIPLERLHEEKVGEKLKLERLEIGGFVIDSQAIHDWFDPDFLVSVKFLNNCIDAGFSIDTEKFNKVKIGASPGPKPIPKLIAELKRAAQTMRVFPPGTVKLGDTNQPGGSARAGLETEERQEREELEARHKKDADEKLTKEAGSKA